MLDRIIFAVIGCIFGVLLACLGWFLYGIGMSLRLPRASIGSTLWHWTQYTGLAFAAFGFIFKDKAGSIVGGVVAAIFHFEGGRDSNLNSWRAVLILAIIVAATWALWQKAQGI